MASPGEVTVKVKVELDDAFAKAMVEEHRALHAYLVARLRHPGVCPAREHSDLVAAHDAVAELMQGPA